MTLARRRRRTRVEIERARRKALSARKNHLLTTHHMSMDQYAALLLFQEGVCWICKRPPAAGKNLHIDHDHAYAKAHCAHPHQESCISCWRGLVHRHCNDLLAIARDKPAIFYQALDYLENPPARRLQWH